MFFSSIFWFCGRERERERLALYLLYSAFPPQYCCSPAIMATEIEVLVPVSVPTTHEQPL